MRCGCQANMATRKPLHSSHSFDTEFSEGGRELFEACRNGDVTKVRRIVNINSNVNLRDTAGRKSSPLHFAAGKRSRWKQTQLMAPSMSTFLKESQSFSACIEDPFDLFWCKIFCVVVSSWFTRYNVNIEFCKGKCVDSVLRCLRSVNFRKLYPRFLSFLNFFRSLLAEGVIFSLI